MAVIELNNISFTYNKNTPSAVCALDHVSLKIDGAADGITGLIGHTGSGKSTLVQMLNGLLKPDEGQVILDGTDIWAEPKKIRDVRFKAGLVMQYPEYQLFAETVREDIAFGPKNMGLTGEELEARVLEAALAGVMAMQPKILILDEPAAGLDPAGRRDILGGIRQYAGESGTTVIIVSHSMEDMAMYCDKLVVMADAKILMHRTCAEVFSAYQELISVGLDVPQITRIASALAEHGADIGADIYTVDYAVRQLLKKL